MARFDQNLFRRVVSDQGYTPSASFQQAMRDDVVLVNQLADRAWLGRPASPRLPRFERLARHAAGAT